MRKTAAVLLILAAACSNERQQVEQAPPKQQPKVAAASLVTPPPPAAVDTRSADFARGWAMVKRWDGERERLEDARAIFMSLMEKDRQYAPAYAGLARVERSSGYINGYFNYRPEALDRASKLAHHALRIDPECFDALTTISRIAADRGDVDEARSYAERAEALRPGHVDVKLLSAAIALRDNQVDDMYRIAKDVEATAPEVADRDTALGYLSFYHEIHQEMDAADAAHRKQLELAPESAWVRGNYASFLITRGHVDRAIELAESAVKIRAYPLGLNTLARAYLAKADELWGTGRYDEAGAYIEKVALMSGDDTRVQLVLGVLLERGAKRTGDPMLRERAIRAYRRAVQLDANNLEAQRALDRLAGMI